MGLTIVVYDERGWERYRSPARIEGTPGSRTLIATEPCSEGFTAHSYAVVDDAEKVVASGAMTATFGVGNTLNLPVSIIGE